MPVCIEKVVDLLQSARTRVIVVRFHLLRKKQKRDFKALLIKLSHDAGFGGELKELIKMIIDRSYNPIPEVTRGQNVSARTEVMYVLVKRFVMAASTTRYIVQRNRPKRVRECNNPRGLKARSRCDKKHKLRAPAMIRTRKP